MRILLAAALSCCFGQGASTGMTISQTSSQSVIPTLGLHLWLGQRLVGKQLDYLPLNTFWMNKLLVPGL